MHEHLPPSIHVPKCTLKRTSKMPQQQMIHVAVISYFPSFSFLFAFSPPFFLLFIFFPFIHPTDLKIFSVTHSKYYTYYSHITHTHHLHYFSSKSTQIIKSSVHISLQVLRHYIEAIERNLTVKNRTMQYNAP